VTLERKTAKNWITAIVSLAVLIGLDQITKALAVKHLAAGPVAIIPGVFELYYLENHGAAFGILQNRQIFFYIITVVIVAAVAWFYTKLPANRKYRSLRVLCVFLTAGAIGNLIDRVALHYVRDFFYFVLIDFPIFNVADIYVTCSAIFLIISILFVYKDEDFAFLKKKGQVKNG
jgi:signal peptidase II